MHTASERDFTCVKYTNDGRCIITGSSDGLVRLYESETLELLNTCGEPTQDESPAIPVTGVSTVPEWSKSLNSFFVATYTSGYVKVWNVQKEKCVTTLDERRQTLGIAFSETLHNFVTYGDDAAIYLYDEGTMSVIQTLKGSETQGKVDGHTSRIFTATFHTKNPNELLTGGWDNTVHYWDIRKTNSMRYISGPHICGDGIAISKCGKEVLTCSYQKETPLQKWDYNSGKLLINYDVDMFRCMLFCGKWLETDFIATGGSDPSLFRVVNTKTSSTIGFYRSQQAGIHCMDFKVTRVGSPKPVKENYECPTVRCVIISGRFLVEVDANLDATK